MPLWSSGADLRLMADLKGERFPVSRIDGAIFVIGADGKERVLTEADLVLEGFAGPSLEIGFSPLHYELDRQGADYQRAARGGPLHQYRVLARLRVGDERRAYWGEEDLTGVWNSDTFAKSGRWLLAWWDESTGQWGPVATAPGDREQARLQITLDQAPGAGSRPVILRWESGRFVAPEKYASAPENALFGILQAGGDLPVAELSDSRDSLGRSWLSYAGSWGVEAGVSQWWQQAGGESDLPRFEPDESPLLLAAMHGHAGTVARLLEAGLDPNQQDDTGFDAGHFAARAGHLEVFRTLLAAGYQAGSDSADGLLEPISLALESGHDDIFALLWEQGASVRRLVSGKQRSRLMMAKARQGQVAMVRYLIDQGANPNFEEDGIPALAYAAESGNPAVTEALLKAGAKPASKATLPPLVAACRANDTATARLLLEAGADPNQLAGKNTYPLLLAVLQGNQELVRLLLEHGAEPAAVKLDELPFGLVETATVAGQKQIVSDLFAAGAACRFKPEVAEDVLMLAFSQDVVEMAILALEVCVSPDFQLYDAYPLAWVADYFKATAIADWLESAGYGADTPPDGLYAASKCDTRPALEQASVPPFSEAMYLAHGNLEERLTVLVDEEGRARLPRFASDVLPAQLRFELYHYLQGWRFRPATVGGVPVKTIVSIPLRFRYTPPEVSEYRTDQVEQLPKAISQRAPFYPPHLRVRGISGSVTVAFVVGVDGRCEQIEATHSTHPFFFYAAREAISEWRFKPALKDGQPVACRVQINMPFSVR